MSSRFGPTLIAVSVFLVAVMGIAHLVQLRARNAGSVDAFWAGGIGIASVAAVIAHAPGSPRAWCVAALAAVWSSRLALHIGRRSARGPEDVRYARLRTEWGAQFERRLFGLLMLEALAGAVLAASVLVAGTAGGPCPGPADVAGLFLGASAIAGEAIADAQMRAFRDSHLGGGAVCDTGLWAFSRHPNYVFEWLTWWAFPVIAIGTAPGRPLSYASLLAPLLLYVLLVHVSGIPPLEREMSARKGEAFRRYQARVPGFLPRWSPWRR